MSINKCVICIRTKINKCKFTDSAERCPPLYVLSLWLTVKLSHSFVLDFLYTYFWGLLRDEENLKTNVMISSFTFSA